MRRMDMSVFNGFAGPELEGLFSCKFYSLGLSLFYIVVPLSILPIIEILIYTCSDSTASNGIKCLSDFSNK